MDLQSDQLAVQDLPGLPNVMVKELLRQAWTYYKKRKTNHLNSSQGITHLFPVQRQVIPRLLSLGSLAPRLRPPDLCVSAPTGSGKTLAFVLPLLASLHGRMAPRVRAIVVLPTQDLATQVGMNGYCEVLLWFDKIYTSVALVQSKCKFVITAHPYLSC